MIKDAMKGRAKIKLLIVASVAVQLFYLLYLYVRISQVKWFLEGIDADQKGQTIEVIVDQIDASYDLAHRIVLSLGIAAAACVLLSIFIWRMVSRPMATK